MAILLVIPTKELYSFEGEINADGAVCHTKAFVIEPGILYVTKKGIYYYNEIPKEPVVDMLVLDKMFAIELENVLDLKRDDEKHYIFYDNPH